jgi:hypothetical protein
VLELCSCSNPRHLLDMFNIMCLVLLQIQSAVIYNKYACFICSNGDTRIPSYFQPFIYYILLPSPNTTQDSSIAYLFTALDLTFFREDQFHRYGAILRGSRQGYTPESISLMTLLELQAFQAIHVSCTLVGILMKGIRSGRSYSC